MDSKEVLHYDDGASTNPCCLGSLATALAAGLGDRLMQRRVASLRHRCWGYFEELLYFI